MVGVNLIPANVLIRHAVRRRVRTWLMAGVVLAAAAAVPMVVEGRQEAQVGRLRGELAVMDSRLSEARVRVAQTAQGVLDTEAQLARGRALRTKRPWADLLALVGSCVPEEAWLTTVATDPATPTASGKRPPADRGRGGSAGSGAGGGVDAGSADTDRVVVLDAPTRLRLEGFALSHEGLYDLMSRLKGSGVFTVVKLVRSGSEPVLQGRAVRFVLMCEW